MSDTPLTQAEILEEELRSTACCSISIEDPTGYWDRVYSLWTYYRDEPVGTPDEFLEFSAYPWRSNTVRV